jgi:uncharacterized protein (DUF1684 family)
MNMSEQLQQYYAERDEYFRSDDSPLKENRGEFKGFTYYPENTELRFKCKLERDPNPETITIETSSGKTREQKRLGWVSLTIEGEPVKLAIFEHKPGIPTVFVPFKDAGSSTETYGGGRYLDPELQDDDTLEIDFNYAYAPYCAYTEGYTCPIPPMENWLKVAIKAGERIYIA